MIKIEVGNSYSSITGLESIQMSALRKTLSYKDDPSVAFYSAYGPRTYYMIDKRGSFPTGLLQRVKNHLNEYDLAHIVIDCRITPTRPLLVNPSFDNIKLYKAQHAAINAAYHNGRGIVSMPTGSGKSLVISGIIDTYNMRTLVIVPNLELKLQLSETVRTLLPKRQDITITNIDDPALKSATNYDLLIIDEAHHSAAKTYRDLNKKAWGRIYYRIFLTATPFRNQANEQLLFESIAGDVIYKLDYKSAVAYDYIVPVEAYFISVPPKEYSGYTWSQVYNELVVDNKPRNDLIAYLCHKLQDKSTLILVKEVKHGELLSKMTGIPFSNGQDEGSRQYIQQFSNGQIKHLIGTNGIIGEGVDTKPCEFVLIAGLGKAKSAFMQQVGRAVRKYGGKESAKVIIFKDPSHKWTKAHFAAQKKILSEEYDIKVIGL